MPSHELRERSHGLLWFGTDQDKRDRWSITDPHSTQLGDACRRLRERIHLGSSDEERQLRSDVHTVLRCVGDYQHLTTYELGVEHIVKKLRVIWRALRGTS